MPYSRLIAVESVPPSAAGVPGARSEEAVLRRSSVLEKPRRERGAEATEALEPIARLV